MSRDTSEVRRSDPRSLAAALAPVLCQTCADRLEDIAWFKADWQRGGAATASAQYTLDDGAKVPVVIKLPIVQRELTWTRRLQPPNGTHDDDLVVPRLYRSGDAIGGYDLTWIIIERFEHGPLGLRWHDDHLQRICDAAVRFHQATAAFEVDQQPRIEQWHEMIAAARDDARTNEIPEQQRWNEAMKALTHRLDDLVGEWRARPIEHWVHGDLHIANAMSRHAFDSGPVSLIDLAEVRPGHWVEDAVYLERQFWARPERLTNQPVKAMARARRKLGLGVHENDNRLAMIRRALLAGTAPHFMKSEGHPVYLQACLERLEHALREL